METFQSQLTRKLSEALSSAGFPIGGDVSPATDPRFGDYQSNAALVLGKQRGENPRKIAETIIANLAVTEISEQPGVAGPGFINFTLKREAVETKIAALLGDERLGVEKVSSPRKIVIDFGSPNVAKPMHVGHIRSTFLGDALARIAEFLGHDVVRDNHIGDWGTQFGMLLVGWKTALDKKALLADPLAEMERIYKLISARCKEDP